MNKIEFLNNEGKDIESRYNKCLKVAVMHLCACESWKLLIQKLQYFQIDPEQD